MKKISFLSAICMTMFISVIGCSSDSENIPINTCPQGFTGSSCTQQITPARIIISKIAAQYFPDTRSNGVGWDSVVVSTPNEADITLDVYKESDIIFEATTYYTDAIPGFEYSFDMGSGVSINPFDILSIKMYDYDDSTYEHMGDAFFTLYTTTGGFPTVKTVTSGQFTYKFYLQYEW